MASVAPLSREIVQGRREEVYLTRGYMVDHRTNNKIYLAPVCLTAFILLNLWGFFVLFLYFYTLIFTNAKNS